MKVTKQIQILVNGCPYPLTIQQLVDIQEELHSVVDIAKAENLSTYPNLDKLDTFLLHILKHFNQ